MSSPSLAALLIQQFPNLTWQEDVDLAPLTYMRIGGPAEVFVDIDDLGQVGAVVEFCRQREIKFRFLAGASNVIVPSDGLPGLTIRITNENYCMLGQLTPDGKELVRASAGCKTGILVRQTIDDGLTGLEYFLGVPGRLGGAIYNNAHYLTDLIGEHVWQVQVVAADNSIKWLTQAECDFKYDYSRFHHSDEVILQVEFALEHGDKERSMEKVKEATIYRAKTQPLGDPSSGCFFRNAPNTQALRQQFPQFAERSEVPSGFLIDQAGLKGTRVGGVSISYKHAAFLINDQQGTSHEVKQLVEIVKNRVREQFGVELTPEVFFLS
jgi:UDP-N-acetylmuramate dehydrogenase